MDSRTNHSHIGTGNESPTNLGLKILIWKTA
jgi:hypothetical protein